MNMYCTSTIYILTVDGGRGNLFPYVLVVTYVSTNGCSVASTEVFTGIARELRLLDKKRGKGRNVGRCISFTQPEQK